MPKSLYSFSKSERLHSETLINQLFNKGKSFVAYPLRVVYQVMESSEAPTAAILVSIPKKRFKHAVDRNLLKRRIREAYRMQKQPLLSLLQEQGKQLHISCIYVSDEIASSKQINQSIATALDKIMGRLC